MGKRVLVFDDVRRDREGFVKSLRSVGCEVLAFGHARARDVKAEICGFMPDLAVVDSKFGSDSDGLYIVRDLRDMIPDLDIVVCSVLFGRNAERREFLIDQYGNITPPVRLLPKAGESGNILPDSSEILGY